MLIIKAFLFASWQQLKEHDERKMGWDFFYLWQISQDP